jgi:hypothetical protein
MMIYQKSGNRLFLTVEPLTFAPLPRLTLLSLKAQAPSMELKLINHNGSSVTTEPTKWPGEYTMSTNHADGKTHISSSRTLRLR